MTLISIKKNKNEHKPLKTIIIARMIITVAFIIVSNDHNNSDDNDDNDLGNTHKLK